MEILSHKEMVELVDKLGWKGFLEYFQEKYKHYRLYSVSEHWYGNPKYICKLKGARGDVIVGWKGVHDKYAI